MYIKEKEETLDFLIKEINSFDIYFEMSDSSFKYEQGYIKSNEINLKLKSLSFSDKKYIVKNLDNEGLLVWNRYFKK